jgi:hypothetical protein
MQAADPQAQPHPTTTTYHETTPTTDPNCSEDPPDSGNVVCN